MGRSVRRKVSDGKRHDKDRKSIVFVFPQRMLPVYGGGAARAWSMIQYLRDSGYRVELVTHWQDNKYRKKTAGKVDSLWMSESFLPSITCFLEQKSRSNIGIVAHLGDFLLSYLQGFRRWFNSFRRWFNNKYRLKNKKKEIVRNILKRNRNKSLEVIAGQAVRQYNPIAIIASFAWTAGCLDRMPKGVLKVIDTHDIQHLRTGIAKTAGGTLPSHVCTREEEIKELSRADAIIAIQPQEKVTLKEMLPDKTILVAEHAASDLKKLTTPRGSKDLLFVGNLYNPNNMGVNQFLEIAWPKIKARFKTAKFFVVGRVCESVKGNYKGVELLGVVPDLEKYYQSAAIVINPVPYGSGLNIKSVEALSYGKCLITTRAGATGFAKSRNTGFIVSSIEKMADKIIEVLADQKKRKKIEEAAWRFAQKRFSPDRAFRELGNILNGKRPD